jgi:hypothetical protein
VDVRVPSHGIHSSTPQRCANMPEAWYRAIHITSHMPTSQAELDRALRQPHSFSPPRRMCKETHTRVRPCAHTCLRRWEYCGVIVPAERPPGTGRACRQYKLRYVDEEESSGKCFQCARDNAGREDSKALGKHITKRKRSRCWLRVLSSRVGL